MKDDAGPGGIVLFIAPGSCSRVPTILLEEIGRPFETRIVRFAAREHKSEVYKAINPKGKVPALVVDGESLTENVAIVRFLSLRFPEAGLLPTISSALEDARQIADLCFCAATLHPLVTRIRMPQMIGGPAAAEVVRDLGSIAMIEYFQLIETRLADRLWWYGVQWSAVDAYLYWIFWRVEGAGFDVKPYPRFVAHARASESRPAVKRALDRERAAEAQLVEEGILPPPSPLSAIAAGETAR